VVNAQDVESGSHSVDDAGVAITFEEETGKVSTTRSRTPSLSATKPLLRLFGNASQLAGAGR